MKKDKNGNNIRILPGVKKKSISELQKAILEVREQLPYFIENIEIQAKIHRAKYNACIKEGFTEQQALEFCKGWML